MEFILEPLLITQLQTINQFQIRLWMNNFVVKDKFNCKTMQLRKFVLETIKKLIDFKQDAV